MPFTTAVRVAPIHTRIGPRSRRRHQLRARVAFGSITGTGDARFRRVVAARVVLVACA
jgi:hypothetical protein